MPTPTAEFFSVSFAVVASDPTQYNCEVSLLAPDSAREYQGAESIFRFERRTNENPEQFNVVVLVPTGIGAEIGGHAGDATAVIQLFSQICDLVVTHPNVVNASDINEIPTNALYVEGSVICRLLDLPVPGCGAFARCIGTATGITADEYDRKARELKARQTEIVLRIEQHQKGEGAYRTTLETLISVASRAAELFERSKTEQQRELLAFVFSNLHLRGKKLEFSLRSPFDLMVNRVDHASWLAFLNTVRTERFDQILALGTLFPKLATAA
jgi:hypothetical protein